MFISRLPSPSHLNWRAIDIDYLTNNDKEVSGSEAESTRLWSRTSCGRHTPSEKQEEKDIIPAPQSSRVRLQLILHLFVPMQLVAFERHCRVEACDTEQQKIWITTDDKAADMLILEHHCRLSNSGLISIGLLR